MSKVYTLRNYSLTDLERRVVLLLQYYGYRVVKPIHAAPLWALFFGSENGLYQAILREPTEKEKTKDKQDRQINEELRRTLAKNWGIIIPL